MCRTEGINMLFGYNLRNYRKSMGLTQKELGDRIGVTSQAVCKWENGTRFPKMPDLLKLCEIFGCTPDDLVKESSDALTAKESSLLAMFRSVSEDVQDIVMTILKSRTEEKDVNR